MSNNKSWKNACLLCAKAGAMMAELTLDGIKKMFCCKSQTEELKSDDCSVEILTKSKPLPPPTIYTKSVAWTPYSPPEPLAARKPEPNKQGGLLKDDTYTDSGTSNEREKFGLSYLTYLDENMYGRDHNDSKIPFKSSN